MSQSRKPCKSWVLLALVSPHRYIGKASCIILRHPDRTDPIVGTVTDGQSRMIFRRHQSSTPGSRPAAEIPVLGSSVVADVVVVVGTMGKMKPSGVL